MKDAVLAALALAGLVAGGRVAHAARPAVRDGDLVAICGDSITEQKLYSVFIEDYLLMCQPAKVRAMQFGWGGETTWGFSEKMANDVLRYKPTFVTTCYGMNDGGYGRADPKRMADYRAKTQAVIDAFKAAGVRSIVLGSPGVVDSKTFRNSPAQATVYNDTLGQERDIVEELAKKNDVLFADVHLAMQDAMRKAKAKYGEGYPVAGGDGIHPGPNGHLIMAYAFLKAMGFDGDIGTITVDLATHRATATDGHKVLASDARGVQVESSRYPFCFTGKPEDPNATASMIQFLPFNEDLNRFTLVVKNAGTGRVKVTFGTQRKEFDGPALEKGINLAAEFLDNPFAAAFAKVHQVVQVQQAFETPMIKALVYNVPAFEQMLPEDKAKLEDVAADAGAHDAKLAEAAAGAVVPVRYVIKTEAVK